MSELDDALKKHGSATKAILAEPFEHWGIGSAMRLIAMMAREVAARGLEADSPYVQGKTLRDQMLEQDK